MNATCGYNKNPSLGENLSTVRGLAHLRCKNAHFYLSCAIYVRFIELRLIFFLKIRPEIPITAVDGA